ncbi:TcpD family membrane protein [Bacillus cereus group sp. BfR-BA-01347]|uniref:TcpD family membrane protein n=1 Tax=Bacillus cereus group sp. BfR-BA-01347 TaxID=2920310 RepID=UPI001F5A28B6|nr:TcpD family membrane protein [Bacillus cereus group sp. BfR-BA-01347]
MLNSQFILGAGLPTLSRFTQWASQEGGNAVVIICIAICVVCLFRQKWGKMIGFLVVAAFTFVTVGNPKGMLGSFKGIIDMFFGG